ncbi:hypothetical protein GGI1_07979 [Acidithiobacillus sp. GGI-221]|nr:hypothetical protein GGI1_07979 [Acidithiobacillus sp. GGI-221]
MDRQILAFRKTSFNEVWAQNNEGPSAPNDMVAVPLRRNESQPKRFFISENRCLNIALLRLFTAAPHSCRGVVNSD